MLRQELRGYRSVSAPLAAAFAAAQRRRESIRSTADRVEALDLDPLAAGTRHDKPYHPITLPNALDRRARCGMRMSWAEASRRSDRSPPSGCRQHLQWADQRAKGRNRSGRTISEERFHRNFGGEESGRGIAIDSDFGVDGASSTRAGAGAARGSPQERSGDTERLMATRWFDSDAGGSSGTGRVSP